MTNSKESYSQSKAFRDFFWNISGVDKELLKKCSISEQNKYFGIGFLIFSISIIAAFSGGYAVYTTTGNVPISVFLGALWGVIILNVDRLLISTMKKDPNNSKWKELRQAIPRFILALAIAFVVSKPVEVKLLEPQINKYIRESNQSKISALNESVEVENNIDQFKTEIDALRRRDSLLNYELDDLDNNPRILSIRNRLVSCKDNYRSIQQKIDSKANERAGIKRLRYSNMVEEVEIWTYNGSKYSEAEFVVNFGNIPSGATRSENDFGKRMNKAGEKRRWILLKEIEKLRKQQLELNCGVISKLLDDEKSKIRTGLSSDLKKTKIELEETDSVYTTIELIVRDEKKTNRNILENSSKGFVGKLIALERLKKDEDYSFYESSNIKNSIPRTENENTVDLNSVIQDSLRKQLIMQVRANFPIYKSDTFTTTNLSGEFEREETKRYIIEDLYKLEKEGNLSKNELQSEVQEEEKGKNTAWWLSLALMFFFMCLEILPLTAKILANYGSYDALSSRQEDDLINEFSKK